MGDATVPALFLSVLSIMFGLLLMSRRDAMSVELTDHMAAVSEKHLRQVKAGVVVGGVAFMALGLGGAWRALS